MSDQDRWKKNKNYVNKNEIENVYFIGFIDQYDLSKIYSISNILILLSREEVWGLVVNEVLYSGIKVIVGNKCGCVPDLVDENNNGIVFKSGSIKSLSSTLNKIK